MIGTIVNTCTIVVGSIIGALLKRGIKPKYQVALFNAMGLVAVAIGLRAFITYMPQSQYPVLFIVSIALGSLVGYMLNIDQWFNKLVERHSYGNLGEGLATGILLYCIGALSMLGPVISALQGDNTFLYTNATLDLVTSAVLAATYGIGMIWAAPVLFCWQGMFYLIARLSSSAISNDLVAELSIVGGLLIFAAGLNLLKIKDCKTLNMLPSLIVPVLFFLLKSLF
ncbi:MAG: DUF554 domain-containing protein [Muribaculaceae bacterium]